MFFLSFVSDYKHHIDILYNGEKQNEFEATSVSPKKCSEELEKNV